MASTGFPPLSSSDALYSFCKCAKIGYSKGFSYFRHLHVRELSCMGYLSRARNRLSNARVARVDPYFHREHLEKSWSYWNYSPFHRITLPNMFRFRS